MLHTSSIDTAFNLASNNLKQWLVVLTFVSACTTRLTALDRCEASSMAANMTTPNQLMELPHPQSHDNASTQTNCERFVDDDELAALSKGVVPAGTDKCARWALTNFAAWMNLDSQE